MPRNTNGAAAAKSAVAAGVEELAERLADAPPGQAEDSDGDVLDTARKTVQRHELDLILSGEHSYYGATVFERMKRALSGSGMNVEAFNTTLVNIVTNSAAMRIPKDPELAQATYRSVIVAGINAASLRLAPQPQAGQVWFVPFNSNFAPDAKLAKDRKIEWKQVREHPVVQTIVGYQGYVTLGYRSGAVRDIVAGFIWPGQGFDTDGLHTLRLEPMQPGWKPEPGVQPDYVYFQVRTTGGGEVVAIHTYTELLEAREYSASWKSWKRAKDQNRKKLPDSPWVEHERPMVRKTAIRWNRALIPLGDATHPGQAAFAHAFAVDGSVGGQAGGPGWMPSGDPGGLWQPEWSESGGGTMQDIVNVEGERRGVGPAAGPPATGLSDAQLLEAIKQAAGHMDEAQDVAVDSVLTAWGLHPLDTFDVILGRREGELPGDRALLVQLYEALQ